jgi:hypothetical protein
MQLRLQCFGLSNTRMVHSSLLVFRSPSDEPASQLSIPWVSFCNARTSTDYWEFIFASILRDADFFCLRESV